MIQRYIVALFQGEPYADPELDEEECSKGRWVKYVDVLEFLEKAFEAGVEYGRDKGHLMPPAPDWEEWKKANV